MAKAIETEKIPQVSVVERRLQRGVFSGASAGIPLKHPERWVTYTMDKSRNDGNRPQEMLEKGWIPLTVDDLAVTPDSIGYRVAPDGSIVRGEQGRHVVMKMPLSDYKAIGKAKSDYNIKDTFGTKQIKSAVVNAVAGAHGSQAAEFVHQQVNTLSVKDSRERVSLDE